MYLPELSDIVQSKATINTFGGVNKKEDCQGNEFINMKNMSSDSYPCIAPRKKRRESDFNWYSIKKIPEVEDLKTNLYLSCISTYISGPYIVAICRTKVANKNCMDNDTIKFLITEYKDKYIKLGQDYCSIKKIDLTVANYGDSTGVLAIYFDEADAPIVKSYFVDNPPPKNLYQLYTLNSENSYIIIPNADAIETHISSSRMVYVNNRFYWLKNGCINYSMYLNEIKAVCTNHIVRTGVTYLSMDVAFTDKIKSLCVASESVGETLTITVDSSWTFECESKYVSRGVITCVFQPFEVGNEYTLSIGTNNDVGNAVIGMLTDECEGDRDLIVGGNKIIAIPSMYTYDTKYSTEERLSDKAEFCLDNGNSNNITIERLVETDSVEVVNNAKKVTYSIVTWKFTVNTAKSANFWKRTVVNKETQKTVKKGYELDQQLHYANNKFLIHFYSSDGEIVLPHNYIRDDNLEQGADMKITEIAANKIAFEMYLKNFQFAESDNTGISGLDYKLREYFPKNDSFSDGKDEKDEDTVRTISKSFLGYTPSYDSTIGYVVDAEMDELSFNVKFACASDNRLFACNQEGDRIFISAIGRIHDFVNEENGTMSADDIGVLTEGNFTGIVSFNHNVYFFKEKCVHKLYGTYSDDWQLVEYHINGVQEGAESSIVVYDNFIIYKGTDAFYLYDGSVATNISEKLGNLLDVTSLNCCFAGSYKDKYYACCETTESDKTVYTTYVYDIGKGLWHIEENNSDKKLMSMCSTSRGLLALEVEEDENIDTIRTINIAGAVFNKSYEEDDFLWSATTGDLLTDLPDNKYFTKLQIRLWVDNNSQVGIDIKYDNEEWEKVGDNITATDKASVVFPIIPRRCDHLALRFYGKGNAKIYSITETIEEASEI